MSEPVRERKVELTIKTMTVHHKQHVRKHKMIEINSDKIIFEAFSVSCNKVEVLSRNFQVEM